LSPDNPQESGRSFGGDLDLLSRMVKAYVRGFHEVGMLTTAKHFPGRGDMKGSPPYPSFTRLDKSLESLDSGEFRAFKSAIDAGVDFIMTEHIAVPAAAAGSMNPASVEPKLIKGVIRERLGFEGVITSDDLWYDHVIAAFGKEDVAVKALEAGHDLVLKPKDAEGTIAAIAEAVRSGRLSQEQVDRSVLKLLQKKARLGLHVNRLVSIDSISATVGTTAHKALVQEVADRSVGLLRNEGVLPLKDFDPARTTHIIVQKEADMPNAALLVRDMTAAFPGLRQFALRPFVSELYKAELTKAAVESDLVLISFFVQRDRHGDPAPLRQEDQTLLNHLIRRKPGKVLAMSFGNPHLVRKLEAVPAFLVGWGEGGFYGNQPVYFSSFIRILEGQLIPTGKLPLGLGGRMQPGFGLTYERSE
jgi:beta-N-acetylhexosaminidase